MRLRLITFFLVLFVVVPLSILSQTPATSPEPGSTDEAPKPTQNEILGLQIAESAILVYSNLQGRRGLDQIRKTGVEFGKLLMTDAAGTVNRADYERRFLRGDNLESSKFRLDQTLPNASYSLVYDGTKTFMIFNNRVFDPQAEVVSALLNREMRGIDGLLRYAESGSKVVFDREEKVMGVDYTVIKLTDKSENVTEYFVSKKSFRIMLLKYEQNGIKYLRKFYDYRYAQNTLYPYRTILWANGKKVEEQDTATITFGQEIGEEYFKFGS